ncbi:DNA polymerase III subunit alpha [Desulfovibrionales bacterium]
MSEFIHLHCHTEYSLLDGAIPLKDLCIKTKDFDLSHVAITDHGNLYGAISFYTMAKNFGLTPIIGCEVYVAATSHTDRSSEDAKKRYHLVLLAQNMVGYHNLVKLVTCGHLYGFHYKPRVDKTLLAQHSEGLIALSACMAGEVPRKLMREGREAGLASAREYANIFTDHFYIELQSNGLTEQDETNAKLIELARTLDLPLVATNDCHYLTAEDVEAHDVLLCIQTGKTVNDPQRMRFETHELYYKSPKEMEVAFTHVPEAIANTAVIANICRLEMNFKSYHFPTYALPEGISVHDEFQRLCRKGLAERLRYKQAALVPGETIDLITYWTRLEHELKVIAQMDFEGYFLIVQDFINWAKDHSIPVGPGRGSAAGSLAAYALRITNIDPIPYNLLFERFLNIERISLPDIDVDFCERRRNEVITYVTERYGKDSVAHITTFGKMKAKAVIRDVARALGLTFAEGDRIAKLIPEDLKMTITKALKQEPELHALANQDPRVARLLDISCRLEGLCRHASTHAAGVVIGDQRLVEYLPLYKGKKEETVTQFDMKIVEKIGLIKFDFLGLKTMTIIQDTIEIIALQGKPRPDLDTIPLDAPSAQPIYELYSRGETDGVFQVESTGMRRHLKQLRPTCFNDIVAMLALYRPGPINSGMVDEFIKRKHGEVNTTYPLPQLEEILKTTYGIIVYQEQVMQIAQVAAGYTLGSADLLRRAMGKKDPVAMAEQRSKFVEGTVKKGITKTKANEIFGLMEKFAEYGFNKSHSAAYALISFWTAWLKTHYPTEFMAAIMTSELNNQDKLLKYIYVCRDMGIEVLPPNINISRREFTVSQGHIVFGLGGVKSVGDEAIRVIMAGRKNGPYISLVDLCQRISLAKVNRRMLEGLIKCGAMDCLGCSRAGLLAGLDLAIERAKRKTKEVNSGQMSLLALSLTAPNLACPGIGLDCHEHEMAEWEEGQKSIMEKEALGFYLTSHPLQPFQKKIQRLSLIPLKDVREYIDNAEVRIGIIVTEYKERINRKGEKWAVCQIEDLTGRIEMLCFTKFWQEMKMYVTIDRPLLITGRIREDSRGEISGQENSRDEENNGRVVKLWGNSVQLLSDVPEPKEMPYYMNMTATFLDEDGLASLKALLQAHRGHSPVRLNLLIEAAICELELGPNFAVETGEALSRAQKAWEVKMAARLDSS